MKNTKGLGRGLDALIPPSESQHDDVLFQCPLEAISPYADQPRRRFDIQKLNELVQTIQEKGVLSPILVRPLGQGYQLISGERRLRAAKLAGLERIPAIVRGLSDQEALELSLIENIQREDLTPLEEARAFQTLMELHDMTHDELARKLGKNRSTITNSVRLLRLSTPIQKALENGRITAGHARCLLGLPIDAQDAFLKEIISKDLSVRATEKLVQSRTHSRRPRSTKPPSEPPELEDLRTQLRSALSTQVRIISGKRKGKIVIEYYTREDLDRIAHMLLH
jgi:ParB family chromosome partitioning protein